jgi:hypothetical protein
MRPHILTAILLVGACGTDPDPREPTFDVVAQEVLAPTCGQVQCHSTTTRVEGYAFDTRAAARESLIDMGVRNGRNNELMNVLSSDGDERMPPDSPLNQQDLDLVTKWIDMGAPGL